MVLHVVIGVRTRYYRRPATRIILCLRFLRFSRFVARFMRHGRASPCKTTDSDWEPFCFLFRVYSSSSRFFEHAPSRNFALYENRSSGQDFISRVPQRRSAVYCVHVSKRSLPRNAVNVYTTSSVSCRVRRHSKFRGGMPADGRQRT